MKKLILFTALLMLGVIFLGCPKPCLQDSYSFNINSQISPDTESIHIGDTIYLTSSFPTSLIDQASGLTINYSDAKDISSTLGVAKFVDGSNIPIDAVFNFDYISIKGRVYNARNIPRPDGTQQLYYQEINGNYELKIALIPKIKGLYGMGIGNGISYGKNNKKSCEKASFEISLNNTDQHFYLFPDIGGGHEINDYEQKHAYYFKVE